MKLTSACLCLTFAAALLAQPAPAREPALVSSTALLTAFGEVVKEAGKQKAAAVAGADGWLFLTSELRFLSLPTFWGEAAPQVSRAPKPDAADPLAAIVDFHQQLKARGVALLVVPVPPKAGLYPDKIIQEKPDNAALGSLQTFEAELTKAGVEVLDLAPPFTALRDKAAPGGDPYCHTDTHWSPAGCTAAAHAMAEWIAPKVPPQRPASPFRSISAEVEIEGDLVGLLPAGVAHPPKEKLHLRQVTTATGKALEPDPLSPVLLIGDSHTLVFHDFAGERAGLLDQLALELGAAPDLIGTRGSGSTAVRLSLYRKSIKDPAYLGRKKVVVWCFAARELTESDQGWAKLPVAK